MFSVCCIVTLYEVSSNLPSSATGMLVYWVIDILIPTLPHYNQYWGYLWGIARCKKKTCLAISLDKLMSGCFFEVGACQFGDKAF